MNCSILVLSCDKYEDIWLPFFKLKDKYWKDCKYKTYISTETKKCKYCDTININTKCWTERIRESLKQIDSDYVIIMCEDFFIRSKVDQKRIEETIKRFYDNTATFNFEKDCLKDDGSNDFRLRDNEEMYLKSCQAGVWSRLKLIKLLEKNLNPWEWETKPIKTDYKYYINTGDFIIDYGYYNYNWFGVCKGKWTQNAIELMNKEGIKIDFNKRGIYD